MQLNQAFSQHTGKFLIGAAALGFIYGYLRGNQTISRGIKGIVLQIVARRVIARYI